MDGASGTGGSLRTPGLRAWGASHWLTVLGIGVAVGLLIAGGVAAYSARQDAWQLAEQQSGNLRLALDRDIARNIAVFDLSLQGVIEALAEPGIDGLSPGLRRHALFDRAAGAEDLGSISVLGPDGDVLESSAPLPRGLNFAERAEFAVHRQRPDVGLYLSAPSRSWFDDDEPSMSISRRLPTRDGQFGGVVSGALRLSFFEHLFEKIDVGPQGSIMLIRTDGHVVWRYPTQDGDMDRDLGDGESFRQMMAAVEGRFVASSSVDGVIRLYSFGRVGRLPLVLSVNLAVDDIYARWRRKAAIIGPVLVAMCAAVVMLSLLFRREMTRREAAERALTEVAQTLSIMAATDALTGLANRRTFEDRLDREWRHALRERVAVSVLMVDADHFKAFNDRYGHQDGDRALRLIAGSIADSLARPADLAARYGGEEFVVLLPGCDAGKALSVAERLRAEVAALDIAHAASPTGTMTVSVGVATMVPSPGDRAFDLIKAADRELYAAKQDGRNVVSARGPQRSGDEGGGLGPRPFLVARAKHSA